MTKSHQSTALNEIFFNFRNSDSSTFSSTNNNSHDKMNNNHSATNGGEYTQMYEKCNDLLSKVQNQKHVNNNN